MQVYMYSEEGRGEERRGGEGERRGEEGRGGEKRGGRGEKRRGEERRGLTATCKVSSHYQSLCVTRLWPPET